MSRVACRGRTCMCHIPFGNNFSFLFSRLLSLTSVLTARSRVRVRRDLRVPERALILTTGPRSASRFPRPRGPPARSCGVTRIETETREAEHPGPRPPGLRLRAASAITGEHTWSRITLRPRLSFNQRRHRAPPKLRPQAESWSCPAKSSSTFRAALNRDHASSWRAVAPRVPASS